VKFSSGFSWYIADANIVPMGFRAPIQGDLNTSTVWKLPNETGDFPWQPDGNLGANERKGVDLENQSFA
jgi:hypothetical protein